MYNPLLDPEKYFRTLKYFKTCQDIVDICKTDKLFYQMIRKDEYDPDYILVVKSEILKRSRQ